MAAPGRVHQRMISNSRASSEVPVLPSRARAMLTHRPHGPALDSCRLRTASYDAIPCSASSSVGCAARSAVQILVEALCIECTRGSCDSRQDCEGNESRDDGLHGCYSRRCRQHHCCLPSMSRTIARSHECRCLVWDSLQHYFNDLAQPPSPPNGG